MKETVARQISDLMLRFKAETDEELAKCLGIGRSTIASWRRRGNIPDRYLSRQPGQDKSVVSTAPIYWSDEERAGFRLALLRASRDGFQDFKNYKQFVKGSAMAVANFLMVFNEAKNDVIRMMDKHKDMSASDAVSLLAYEEFHKEPTD